MSKIKLGWLNVSLADPDGVTGENLKYDASDTLNQKIDKKSDNIKNETADTSTGSGDTRTLTEADSGNVFNYATDTSGSLFEYFLPQAPTIGTHYFFIKTVTNTTLTIHADTGDTIMDSASSGNISNNTNELATLHLHYSTNNIWVILGATGSWTTT